MTRPSLDTAQWGRLPAPFPAAPDDPVSILLVDDQPANLSALEATLESTNCRFVLARTADEALLALLDQDFAAIVLDIRMPGMSGFELAGMIRRRQRNRHVPILFLTAFLLEEEDVLQGYAAGAVDYLTKPIKPEILRAKIAVFVDLYRNRRSLSRLNASLQKEITDRQRVEEALRKANQDLESRVQERTAALQDADRRKDAFLATLAHDLRHSLATVRAAADALQRQLPAGADTAQHMGAIDRQLRHLGRLTDALTDTSLFTRDTVTLQRERVGLKNVLATAVETVRPLVQEQGHTLTLDLPQGAIWLDGDVVRLSQVFAILLDNAVKYTEPGGRIRLAAAQENGEALVTVSDSGVGMARDAAVRVFDLFTTSDEPARAARRGLGVGLALARRLVQLHGGTITANSEGRGKGAEFIVRLPLAEEPSIAAAGDVTTSS